MGYIPAFGKLTDGFDILSAIRAGDIMEKLIRITCREVFSDDRKDSRINSSIIKTQVWLESLVSKDIQK
jgi:hypothetical protein